MVQKKRLVAVVILLIIVILITTWGIRLAQNQAISTQLIPSFNTCVFFAKDFNSMPIPIESTCTYFVGGHDFINLKEVIFGTALPVSEQRFGGWEITGDRVSCQITQTSDFQDNPIDEFSNLISGLMTLPLKNLLANQIVNCKDTAFFEVEFWELIEEPPTEFRSDIGERVTFKVRGQ